MAIDSFREGFYFLSNCYLCPIKIKGILWPSVEHIYCAAKTNNLKLREEIRLASSPQMAKYMGKSVQLVSNWNEIKINVMLKSIRLKFIQNADIKELLLMTLDIELIEGNLWHDNFWGDCRCKKCKNIKGENNLGKLLMKVRAELNKN